MPILLLRELDKRRLTTGECQSKINLSHGGFGFVFGFCGNNQVEWLYPLKQSNRLTMMQDAADAIEELLAAVPKWISVEERLPDVAEKVITYNGDFVSENWLCTVASKDGRINVWAYSEGFVTHWMPLPEPPKEDAE